MCYRVQLQYLQLVSEQRRIPMTAVRTIPVHEVVRRTYPRPPAQERDEIAMAVGKAIDGALSRLGFELRQGRRPTQAGIAILARTLLSEALEEAAVTLPPAEVERTLVQIRDVIRAYRRSEIAGLTRPRTRVILIDRTVGVYAQPDFWDGRRRFFEMKSYRAIPPPEDVALQLLLFQLAFPGFEAVLVCLDRHAQPVDVISTTLPPPTDERSLSALRTAYRLGREFGQEKILEFIEGPFVHYNLPPARG